MLYLRLESSDKRRFAQVHLQEHLLAPPPHLTVEEAPDALLTMQATMLRVRVLEAGAELGVRNQTRF